jgi:hypothetical protein
VPIFTKEFEDGVIRYLKTNCRNAVIDSHPGPEADIVAAICVKALGARHVYGVRFTDRVDTSAALKRAIKLGTHDYPVSLKETLKSMHGLVNDVGVHLDDDVTWQALKDVVLISTAQTLPDGLVVSGHHPDSNMPSGLNGKFMPLYGLTSSEINEVRKWYNKDLGPSPLLRVGQVQAATRKKTVVFPVAYYRY